MTAPRYSMDTSALITLRVEQYAPDVRVFGALWTRIEQLIASERMFAFDEVIRDLQKNDDDLFKWTKAQKGMIVVTNDDIQTRVRTIVKVFPSLVDIRTGRGRSDPYVIAIAQSRDLVVVTTEGFKPTKPKIPDVCKALGIACLDLLELFRREQW